MRKVLFVVSVLVAGVTAHSTAQHQLIPVAQLRGEPALELQLRKLDTVGNFMMTTAHPDDENNAMLAYFSHGKGYRTSLVTATHGEGGQNEIGPELFVPLAVLRTEELLAAHRFDGAEQFFTRAIDFGFSFSVEETLEKWGHDEILGDYVRMIRTIRPDVIVGFVFDGDGGGQHHQTSSRLTLEAFRAAADPARFPEQIKEGLRPWQAKKFYYTAGFGGPRPARAAGCRGCSGCIGCGGADDPRLYRRRAVRSGAGPHLRRDCRRSAQHAQVPGHVAAAAAAGADRRRWISVGGPAGVRAYRLRDSVLEGGVARPEKEIFDGVDTSLRSLLSLLPRLLRRLATDSIASARRSPRRARRFSRAARARPSRRSTAGLKALREVRAIAGIDEPSGSGAVRNRFPTGAEGAAVCPGIDARHRRSARRGRARRPRRCRPAGCDRSCRRRIAAATTSRSRSRSNGFGAAPVAACPEQSALAPGASRNCNRTVTVPADARLTAAHFRNAPAGRAICLRLRRAVRPAVPADAVHGDVHDVGERHAVHDHAPDPGAIGTRHLQRREAIGDSRRARVCRDDDAGDPRGLNGRVGSREPGDGNRKRRARDRHQSREGRGEGGRRARPAARMARDAGDAGRQLHARRRADDGALRAAAAIGGDAGGRGNEAGRQPVRGQDARHRRGRRPTRRATRSSSIRTPRAGTCSSIRRSR